MKKFNIYIVCMMVSLLSLISCKKYLDVVPDNVATIDNAFTLRAQAQKYLFTCYSYMPQEGNLSDDPGILGGDEMWDVATKGGYFNLAKGLQNKNAPYGDRWVQLYRGLRDCNIFLENIGKVPDMDSTEKNRWIAEVKFLKAYYHFYLVRMYGPIPIIKENLSINADIEKVKVSRDPVDSCFNYIVRLLNEAAPGLPVTVVDPASESGRITQPVALALKAKVLVTAASPLFNGNTDQSALKNNDGQQLFNQQYSKEKWDSAYVACKKAVEICKIAGNALYEYTPSLAQSQLSEQLKTQMSIRNSFAEKWNREIIWGNTQTISSTNNLQKLAATWWDPAFVDGTTVKGEFSPPLKIAEMFYSKNGVPIDEDKTYNYNGRYGVQVATTKDKLLIKEGYTTANLNFNREPRFYADLGFDGGIYYGQGKYDDTQDLYYLEAKYKERNGFGKTNYNTVTGYYVKKYVYYQNVIGTGSNYSITNYPWPLIRLADLYLLLAEAQNEVEGPGQEVYDAIDIVRKRADLPTVEVAWRTYSTNPSKYLNKDGLREIIQRERLIELAFESQRFWDLRRWKLAAQEMNNPIIGWDIMQAVPKDYYRPITIFNQTFSSKEYFWPIKDANIEANRNIVQNLGW